MMINPNYDYVEWRAAEAIHRMPFWKWYLRYGHLPWPREVLARSEQVIQRQTIEYSPITT